MTTRTVVCPDCETPLAPGRFSCSFCGALVASVASAPRPLHPTGYAASPVLEGVPPAEANGRHPAPAAGQDDAPAIEAAPEVEAALGPGAAPEPGTTSADEAPTAPPTARGRSRRGAASSRRPATVPEPEREPAEPAATIAADAPITRGRPAVPDAIPEWPAPEPERPARLQWPATEPERPASGPEWPARPEWPSQPEWPAQSQRLVPTAAPPAALAPATFVGLAPAPFAATAPATFAATAPAPFAASPAPFAAPAPTPFGPDSGAAAALAASLPRNPAGAYLPPSAVLPPAEALPLPGAKAGRSDGDARERAAGAFASIQLGISPRAPALSIVGGAGLAALGFLLPWADIVLGASSMGGYFDRWGLAGPGHPVVLAILLALAGFAFISDRLPRLAAPRVPGVAVAFLLFGLAWPYLFGPYNASLGIFFVTAGAVIVFGGALLDLVVRRHAEPSASV